MRRASWRSRLQGNGAEVPETPLYRPGDVVYVGKKKSRRIVERVVAGRVAMKGERRGVDYHPRDISREPKP